MKRIDVQHHILPEEYVERLASIGITESYGQPFPKWTPEKSLALMKKIGIDIAIMSISTPGVDLKDAQFARELARLCNEYMADVKQQYPERFGGFAISRPFAAPVNKCLKCLNGKKSEKSRKALKLRGVFHLSL